MTVKFEHYGLITGLISVILSFLFVAREQNVYQLLLVGGFLISLVCFLLILFGKESGKTKLLWTLIVVFGIIIQLQTERVFITSSYRFYLENNYSTLVKVNNLLKDKPNDISIHGDRVIRGSNNLTLLEMDKLFNFKKELDVYMISKSENGIYYGLWGMLDVRLGLAYCPDSITPAKEFRHLKDNWWYH